MRLSQGLVEWVAVSAPSPVAAGGGAFTPVGLRMENHGVDLWGLDDGSRSKKPLENKVISGKTRTPPASGAGGVRKGNR